ncbi:DUF6448 family protein [Streptomyces sp. NPDC048825]|uniref:DUF6448 family protein n=1 Tax=Streptomyces sp. NPDC048825 TaxID=3365592 RepID=UPI0037167B9C
MPPHCDSLDGPIVTAARKALEGRDVDQVLPHVPEAGEPEVREGVQPHRQGADARPGGAGSGRPLVIRDRPCTPCR